MKHAFYRAIFYCAVTFSALQLTACKKDKVVVDDTNATTVETPPTPEPVEITPDAELNDKVTDAIKDFPGVNATVADGEVTLTGEITRDRLPMLMQSLHALNPKKINNNLTIK
jgi:hypothetical protein